MRTTRRHGARRTASAIVVALATLGLLPGGVAAAPIRAKFNAAMPAARFVPLRGRASTIVNIRGDVDYNGGAVMPSNTDYLVFWSPRGLSSYGAEYVSGLERYFADLAHDSGGDQNVDSVTAQYNDLTGARASYHVVFGGGFLDSDAYPSSQCPTSAAVTHCLTDHQLQVELEHFVASHHFKTDLSHEYFLLTPPHVESCFTSNAANSYGGCSAGIQPASLGQYCAYHSNSTVNPPLIYAIDPYVTGNAGCEDGNHPNGPSDGAIEGGLSHEHNESISDPFANDAWTDGAAGTLHGFEMADLCQSQYGAALGKAADGARYNQVINGHFYWYQEEWSNVGQKCVQRLATGFTQPTATFSVKAGAGLALTFDASHSSATGGIAAYIWQFNAVNAAAVVSTRSPVISHTFPVAGAYSVGLTVLTANGNSTGTGGIVLTGHNGVSPGFGFTPSSPAAGHAVSFSAFTKISRLPVLTWLWEFGDGTTGYGQAPKHTYARSGTYKVVLVMFSGEGSAWPSDGAGPISTRTVKVG